MSRRNNHYLKMETHYLPIPYYKENRRIRVLLPKDYEKDTWASYPVLYMHDGQNVFYSKESYSGYSWKVIPTLKEQTSLPKMIVVGIDNGGIKRLDEYGPWQTDLPNLQNDYVVGGVGMAYGEWVVNELKPFIDSQYRTKKEAKQTLLAGSSMGGLITAYMGSAYPDVFGTIGVFSLASWFSQRDFLDFVSHHPIPSENKIYLQVGTNEGDDVDSSMLNEKVNQVYIDTTLEYYQSLIGQGVGLNQIWLRILADEIHHEKYWADHFLEFLLFAFE
ncbi:alpha/beta hydrolase [Fundicoccus culcitae]|uniref:Alpha/beta hydrolase-fold protein n=1 Tax=Fundicoccus culcitae TaxID=2969821 RepID=A0ABY5P6D4_9LACT|nr:alpha/beta hydrolase-fold protein [Fundicoccus culcitae]UUX34141.1 alpha/beta hydrolase-fold protein [Fundicoccus culcitae]